MKKLNFGSGNEIKEGWDNVDIQKDKRLTKSFDFNKFPYPLKDNTYDYIYTRNVLEHLIDVERVIEELWRIGKPNSIIEISVPYYNNKGAYSSLQHIHFFNEVAFKQLVEQKVMLNKKETFKIISIKLIPTKIGIILPKVIREKLSLFIGGLIAQIEVIIEVKK